jgi:2-C-methyl-D-erythritol 4-phosphate cytidylyltransferase
MNAASILAGGTGERMRGLDMPKQYYSHSGRPLIAYCLRTFEECDEISGIVIVADKAWRSFVRDLIRSEGITKFWDFADPGKARQESVYSGLLMLEDRMSEDDIAVIHDAVRPMTTGTLIRECIAEASRRDGATPVLRVSDTVYMSKDGHSVHSLLNREELYVGQTPEAYRFGKYMVAHGTLTNEELARVRGSSEIAFASGMDICLFPGDENNFKITTVADLERFRLLTENRDSEGQ